jgi:hypothetical protein
MVDYLVRGETKYAKEFMKNVLFELGIPFTEDDRLQLDTTGAILIDPETGYVGVGIPDDDMPLVRGQKDVTEKFIRLMENYRGEKVWESIRDPGYNATIILRLK